VGWITDMATKHPGMMTMGGPSAGRGADVTPDWLRETGVAGPGRRRTKSSSNLRTLASQEGLMKEGGITKGSQDSLPAPLVCVPVRVECQQLNC
jgi:hypothetical protein